MRSLGSLAALRIGSSFGLSSEALLLSLFGVLDSLDLLGLALLDERVELLGHFPVHLLKVGQLVHQSDEDFFFEVIALLLSQRAPSHVQLLQSFQVAQVLELFGIGNCISVKNQLLERGKRWEIS